MTKTDKIKILIYTGVAIISIFTDRPYLCVGVVIGEVIYEFFREDKQMLVICGAPGCGGTFSSIKLFETHWKHEHLEYYGWSMFGCHPTIICDTSTSKVTKEEKE